MQAASSKTKTKLTKQTQQNPPSNRKNCRVRHKWALISGILSSRPIISFRMFFCPQTITQLCSIVQSKHILGRVGVDTNPVIAIVEGNTYEMKVLIKHQKSLLE